MDCEYRECLGRCGFSLAINRTGDVGSSGRRFSDSAIAGSCGSLHAIAAVMSRVSSQCPCRMRHVPHVPLLSAIWPYGMPRAHPEPADPRWEGYCCSNCEVRKRTDTRSFFNVWYCSNSFGFLIVSWSLGALDALGLKAVKFNLGFDHGPLNTIDNGRAQDGQRTSSWTQVLPRHQVDRASASVA